MGQFIAITSVSVKQPLEGLILSNSVRSAVNGLVKSLSNEYAGVWRAGEQCLSGVHGDGPADGVRWGGSGGREEVDQPNPGGPIGDVRRRSQGWLCFWLPSGRAM